MSKASDLARLMTSGSTAVHGEAGLQLVVQQEQQLICNKG